MANAYLLIIAKYPAPSHRYEACKLHSTYRYSHYILNADIKYVCIVNKIIFDPE